MSIAALLLLLHVHGYRLVHEPTWPGIRGVTDTGAHTVTLFGPEPRYVLAYEVGHVLDVSCLSDAQRRSWQHLRHLHGEWYAPDLSPETGYGSGDFAASFMRWSGGERSHALRTLAWRFHFGRGVCA